MLEPETQTGSALFGPFRFDLASRELFRDGLALALEEKPARLLSLLIANAGQVVSREELRDALWPSDVHIDFRHGLNKTVNKLRSVLGEDANEPRFIETLSRRGYRFTAPVELVGNGQRPTPPGEEATIPSTAPIPAEVESATRRSHRSWMLAALVMVGAMGFLFRPVIPPPRVPGYAQITNDGQEKLFGVSGPSLCTDGSRIFIQENAGGRAFLAQASLAGGETVPIKTPFQNVFLYSIAPDGAELLVGSFTGIELEHALWRLPILGGAPRRLGDLLGHGADWSRSQKQKLAVASGRALYVTTDNSSESHLLASVNGIPRMLHWSPDGRVLRFSLFSVEKSNYSLWEVSADGTNLHPLLPGWNNEPAECCGIWTADGKYFLFQATRDGKTHIWAIREKGDLFRKTRHLPVQLTSGPMSFSQVVASADGKKLFVVGDESHTEVVRYDAKSGEFLPYLPGVSAGELSFSPDGRWVAYVFSPEGTLWRSKVDGSERLQLTYPPSKAALPRWSPDGMRIAYQESAGGLSKPDRILVVSPEGGIPEELPTGRHSAEGPTWSPDGRAIYFLDADWTGGKFSSSIKSLDLQTKEISDLPGSEGMFLPSLSPDGRYLLTFPINAKKLLFFDFATKKWLHLVDLPHADIGSQTWSADSKYVYFDTGMGNDPAICRVRITDHKVERIASLSGLHRAYGGWGLPWSGLSPDGSPLILRNIGSQEVYALDWEAP